MGGLSFGRWFGFPVTVDPTALLVLGLISLSGARAGARDLLEGLLYGIGLFGSIMVHELGHAFVARRFGLGPISIMLHGFGGLTRFGRAPRPLAGVLVTLAGPLAGAALGLVLVLLPPVAPWLHRVGVVSLFWSAFNLLPMFPLDGGMILAHGLALGMRQDRALRWAGRVGVVVGAGVALWALLTGQFVLLAIVALSLSRTIPLALGR